MNLNPRLRRLEAHHRQLAPHCEVCGGGIGRTGRVIVRYDEEPSTPVQPCNACRREPLVIHVVYTDASQLTQDRTTVV
jgi:hypothetical protein